MNHDCNLQAAMARRPFSSGTHFMDWCTSNCERCKKGSKPGASNWPTCEIEAALVEALFDDGYVADEIIRRMGMLDHPDEYVWMCQEVDWTDEWKLLTAG